MAIRKSRARRELITRTARVWTRINKKIVEQLTKITQDWLKDTDKNFPEEKFTKILKRNLREALAYGYWLQWLYLYELRGKKYRGSIKLSEGDSVKDSVQKFMSTGEWNDVIPKDAVNWINNYVPKLSGNFSSDILDKTRDVIKNSLQDGTTLQQREKELSKVLDVSKSRIENIARTEITRAHNLGSLSAMKANQDVIGVEFSAVLDNRTTPMCSERHGLRMRLDDPRIPENTPPLHCRCRSMLISLTVYDYPDGLLTSHEFDDGISAGEQRPEDIEEVRKIVEPNEEPTLEHTGVLSEYHIEDFGSRIDIHFDNNAVRGEDTYVTVSKKANAAERTKAINSAINEHRPALELAASSRRGGFATFEMSQKWGGRLLTDAEKNQVNQEIEQHIKNLFKSPLSKKGKELNESFWKKESGGWRRLT